MLLPSENPFKRHEEILSLQPMILPSKRFDIFPPVRDSQKVYMNAFRIFYKHDKPPFASPRAMHGKACSCWTSMTSVEVRHTLVDCGL